MGKTVTLRELMEKFHNIENAEGQMLEADSYLEKSMIICHGIEKMYVSYRK